MEDLNERQIQILRLLAGQTEPLRNPELARRFGCSIKTIQRDFKRIEILGLSLGYTLLRSSQGIVLDCGNADRGRLNRWIYGGDRLSSGDSVGRPATPDLSGFASQRASAHDNPQPFGSVLCRKQFDCERSGRH